MITKLMTTMAMLTKNKMITKLMTMTDTKPITFVFCDSLPQSSAFDNDDDKYYDNDNDNDDDNNSHDNDYKADNDKTYLFHPR